MCTLNIHFQLLLFCTAVTLVLHCMGFQPELYNSVAVIAQELKHSLKHTTSTTAAPAEFRGCGVPLYTEENAL